MMEYLKYLKSEPMKVLWLLFVWAMCLGITVAMYMWDGFTSGWSIGVSIFMVAVFITGNYQPYKEWKDGLKNK